MRKWHPALHFSAGNHLLGFLAQAVRQHDGLDGLLEAADGGRQVIVGYK